MKGSFLEWPSRYAAANALDWVTPTAKWPAPEFFLWLRPIRDGSCRRVCALLNAIDTSAPLRGEQGSSPHASIAIVGSRCGGRKNCRHCVQRRRTGRSNRTTEAVRPDLHGSASRRGRDGENGRRAFGRTAAGWGDRAGRSRIGREGRGGQEEGGLCGNAARPSCRAKPGELCGVVQFDRESEGQGNVLEAPRNARGREKGLLPASERPGSCGSDAGGAAAFEIADGPAAEWFRVDRWRMAFERCSCLNPDRGVLMKGSDGPASAPVFDKRRPSALARLRPALSRLQCRWTVSHTPPRLRSLLDTCHVCTPRWSASNCPGSSSRALHPCRSRPRIPPGEMSTRSRTRL